MAKVKSSMETEIKQWKNEQLVDTQEGLYDPSKGCAVSNMAFGHAEQEIPPHIQDCHLGVDMCRILRKLDRGIGDTTPYFNHFKINIHPVMYRTRFWGYKSISDNEVMLLVDRFRTYVKHIWMDLNRKTLCVDWTSATERPDGLWINTGIGDIAISDLTSTYPFKSTQEPFFIYIFINI